MGTKGWMALLLCLTAVACCSCESDQVSGRAADSGLYTRYNLHYISEGGVNKASYANWTEWPGHALLPYNSKIQATSTGSRIYIVAPDTGMRITFEFHPGRMAMSAADYIALITSPTPVTYDGLSDVDRQGIAAGKALVGMSKQGVMVALGYPAKHRTASLEEKRWIYWKGRHDTYAVEFDDSGKVVSIVD